MEKIRIGIAGYGNLGRGVECAVKQNPDMEIAGIYTRRDPSAVKPLTEGVKVFKIDALEEKQDIDVLILCMGSATELPIYTPKYAAMYNVIDSFDNHNDIPKHFANVDAAAKKAGKLAAISLGWDPGLFSLSRAIATLALPRGENYTFWGRGVSQGHSNAIRRIEGVLDARQYTVPIESAVEAVRRGENPVLTTRQKHTRECFVVAAEGADKEKIRQTIVNMPDYFADYDTTVTFITQEELDRDHKGLPHGGSVIRSGKTGWNEENDQVVEFKLTLDSNPEFTSGVLVAYARAVARLAKEGRTGCMTIFDIPVSYALPVSPEEMRAHML
ncbi:MAG: diaminopimelate dehydrogenase [Firmicutes bacterium]|nr:diaminopimelate dehydrogenase [Bacillota bacterium]MBQ2042126.1 diaminopimelate dehydrogenase [Bacillota bacterium]MBQ5415010.1 diaminopimelate dehydrogenase [Bacillota bacterium]